jgi:hypothetical protein
MSRWDFWKGLSLDGLLNCRFSFWASFEMKMGIRVQRIGKCSLVLCSSDAHYWFLFIKKSKQRKKPESFYCFCSFLSKLGHTVIEIHNTEIGIKVFISVLDTSTILWNVHIENSFMLSALQLTVSIQYTLIGEFSQTLPEVHILFKYLASPLEMDTSSIMLQWNFHVNAISNK